MTEIQLTNKERQWHIAYAEFTDQMQHFDRDIVVTPFGGAYGVAGWIIAIEGTPPRGLLLVYQKGGALEMYARQLYRHDIAMRKVDGYYRQHMENSKHKQLWNATLALLKERGIDPG